MVLRGDADAREEAQDEQRAPSLGVSVTVSGSVALSGMASGPATKFQHGIDRAVPVVR